MDFILNIETRNTILKYTGMKADDISKMNVDEIDKKIEEKIGKKIKLKGETDPRLIGRGSVYLYLLRFLGIDYIDKKLSKI